MIAFLKERDEAVILFKSKKGRELQREIAKKAKTFVPGANLQDVKKVSGKLIVFNNGRCCKLNILKVMHNLELCQQNYIQRNYVQPEYTY